MERRVLLAVFLSFLVLYGYQALIGPPPVDPEAPPAEVATEGSAPPASAPVDPPVPRSPTETAPSAVGRFAPVDPPTPVPVVGDQEPRDIVVESEAFRAVFTNRGAELVSWELKEYLEQGRPVELVPRNLPADEPWPFSLAFDTEALTRLAGAALYRSSHPDLVRVGDRPETLVFDFEDATGLRITKRFTFDPARNPYLMGVAVDASVSGEPAYPALRWGPALGGVESSSSGIAFLQGPRGLIRGRVREADTLGEVDVFRLDASDIAGRATYDGQFDYVGVDNHYFIAVALPEATESVVRYRAVPLPPVVPDGDPRELVAFDLALSPGEAPVDFFIGPKDFDILADALPTLSESIDFGFLAVLVVPLHQSLEWVHSWVGNYGFSIIVVTLLINIVILPLRHKSVVSMRKMQEIQPEMKAIQDRYAHLKATDPEKQKMNQEVMALYRDRGVNPVSGCLPMLLTMPILFAFYRLLSMSIELRGAPFVGWINDLSMHDPLYITPIVMGGSMVLQQRLTPSQADPTQQKIMMLMPVVFTFMFLWAPSGLVIYWLTSNLIGIGQQVVTNRIIGPPKQRTVRPAAERRVNPARGGGKAGGDRAARRRAAKAAPTSDATK